MKARIRTRRLAASCLLLAANQVAAFDLGQSGTVHAVAAASLQCQLIGEGSRGVDACRGAAPLQPELEWHPGARDRLHLKLGFAAGNGLSEVSPFTLSPWAADLEADTRDINGSGRNYLLTVWWRHHFELSPPFGLATTLGLIDSTDYLDNNAYANDEYTQFMNEALVNGPNAFLPSYDPGAAIELEAGRWSLHGVAMRVGEDTDDSQFGFDGGQLAYRMRARGEYRAIYSGGIDIGGCAWNREQDNIGFGTPTWGLFRIRVKSSNLRIVSTQLPVSIELYTVTSFPRCCYKDFPRFDLIPKTFVFRTPLSCLVTT